MLVRWLERDARGETEQLKGKSPITVVHMTIIGLGDLLKLNCVIQIFRIAYTHFKIKIFFECILVANKR